MKFSKFIAAGMVAVLATACAQNGQRDDIVNKENIGTLAGAGLGAWAGSNVGKGSGNVAAIAVGTLLGAGIGKEVGASLDRADMAYYNQTSQQALETSRVGVQSTWANPDSGNSGTFTPTRTYQTAGGQYCREYTQTINVGGKTAEGHGTACRQPDGTWQITQ